MVPWGRCTGRKEREELPCLSRTALPVKPAHIRRNRTWNLRKCQSYLLVAIDEYIRLPEVEVTKSTSAYSTIPKLDKMFITHGVLEEVKSDNGPPFQSADFKRFVEHSGFKHSKITPEWPQANKEAKRFMRTLEKDVRCAMIERKGWKQEMYRFVHSYRATPHSSTPATALFNRSTRATLPEIKTSLFDKIMRETDAKPSNLQRGESGDTVLVKQKTPYKPPTYEVVARKGTVITANKNDDHTIKRNISTTPSRVD